MIFIKFQTSVFDLYKVQFAGLLARATSLNFIKFSDYSELYKVQHLAPAAGRAPGPRSLRNAGVLHVRLPTCMLISHSEAGLEVMLLCALYISSGAYHGSPCCC